MPVAVSDQGPSSPGAGGVVVGEDEGVDDGGWDGDDGAPEDDPNADSGASSSTASLPPQATDEMQRAKANARR